MDKQFYTYPTKYKDQQGVVFTEIENHFNEKSTYCLFMQIDGLIFQGSAFDDFELLEPEKYSAKQLKRFTLNKVKVLQSEEYVQELCNFELEFSIPVLLVNNQLDTPIKTTLELNLILGKPMPNGGIDSELAGFQIILGTKTYNAEGDLFETGLEQLQQQFEDKYHFRNCFGCQYSDYSPYGNGFFGTMLCFKDHKQEYLNVSSKSDLFKLTDMGFIQVQETYCCSHFKIRRKNSGYRG